MRSQRLSVISSCLLLIILWTACSATPNISLEPVTETLPQFTNTSQPTQTSTPDPTPTALPTQEFDYDCSTSSKLPGVDLYFENGKLARMGNGGIQNLELSPDGEMIAVGSTYSFFLYTADTLELLNRIETDFSFQEIKFSPNSKLLALIGYSKIYIWDIASESFIATIHDRSTDETLLDNIERMSVVFSPDSLSIALLSKARTKYDLYELNLEIWNIDNEELEKKWETEFDESKTDIFQPDFSPDGKWIASPWNNGVNIWDINSGEIIFQYPGCHKIAEFSPDGKTLLTQHASQIQLINLSNNNTISIDAGFVVYPENPTFSNDGKRLLLPTSVDLNRKIQIYSTNSGYLLHSIPTDWIDKINLTPNNDEFLISTNGSIQLWNYKEEKIISNKPYSKKIADHIFPSYNGEKLVAQFDSHFFVIGANDGSCLVNLEGQVDESIQGFPHPLSELFAATTYDHEIYVWDFSTGKLIQNSSSTNPELNAETYVTRQTISSTHIPGDIERWIWKSNNTLPDYWQNGYIVEDKEIGMETHSNTYSVNSNGTLVAYHNGGTISIIDIPSDSVIWSIPVDKSQYHIKFSPDGKFLAVIGLTDGSITLYDFKKSDNPIQIADSKPSDFNISSVDTLLFSTNGTYMLNYNITKNPALRLWNTETWETQNIRDFRESPRPIQMSADGSLITTFTGYTLYLWHNELPLSE